jgi:hypothetical protein
MHPYDDNARRQLAREHVARLTRDAQRPPRTREPRPEQAEHAVAAALFNRLRRRRPARAAEQRP